ncbi:coiled-coil domain-containing protein 186 isoform X2 [Neodiprion pinetum]|uniref:coiled-coil domain-containing protein 186 isoform X2 n=1 Tax=Neodiprion pinetum TaxID=441929 RepID=UPI001EE15474|nr:coiled-coil domain-containing protein 186 isoform X2 [Neodiprion pinetum]
MDEVVIQSFDNITRDSEKCFVNVKTADMDSSLQCDNGSKKEEVTLPTNATKDSSNYLDNSLVMPDDNLDVRKVHSSNKITEVANQRLKNLCGHELTSLENQDISSTFQLSLINSSEEVNSSTDLTRLKKFEMTKELTNDTLLTNDSGNNEEEINFNHTPENSPIQLPTPKALPEDNFEISLNSIDIPGVVPDKMNIGQTSDVTLNKEDAICQVQDDKKQVICNYQSMLSDNDREHTILNNSDQMAHTVSSQPTSPQSSAIYCHGQSVKSSVVLDISRNNQVSDLSSTGDLIRSDPTTDLSTIHNINKSSLANDAKLVKFSVSSKSMNILQSNAQFLNKSRNFLNFITEKSTNIMEKTLLPQNLAAKYNNILRMTENNPTDYKTYVEGSGTSSNSVGLDLTPNGDDKTVHNTQASCQIMCDVTDESQHINTSNLCDRVQQHESTAEQFSIQDNSTNEDGNSFYNHSMKKHEPDSTIIPQEQETETSLPSNVPADSTSKNSKPSHDLQMPNRIVEELLNNLEFNSGQTNRDTVSSVNVTDSHLPNKTVVAMHAHNLNMLDGIDNTNCSNCTSSIEINEQLLIKENTSDDVILVTRNNSNSDTSPSSQSVSSEHFSREHERVEHNAVESQRDKLIDLGLLDQPVYVTLVRDYRTLKEENSKLSETVLKLEMENQRFAAENNSELYVLQLETLEKTIEKLRSDLRQATANQEVLKKEYLLANKEKESMVMKYAISEKQLIETQRAREYAERKINEAFKEQELLHTKLKQVQGERTRICNILDGKCHELTDVQKEVDRLKEELSMRDVKLKWTQNKLKTELEAQKENQQKLDKAMIRINEMKEECEQVRKESHETIRKFQQSEENKVVTLDQQLKEQQARLILERHVTEDKEMSRLQLQKEVETLKQRQLVLIEENNTLGLKVQNLEKERLNYENNLSNLKVIADQRQKEIVDLVGKVSQLETLKLQLTHKEQLLSSNDAEVERLRQSNTELQADMEWCREREAHMLDFTQKLTDKNVRLQSEFTAIEAKNEQLELEQGPLHDQIKELSAKVKLLEVSLSSEKSKRTEECELLARHVAEQTQLARNLAQKLEDSQGENAVLRRKQQISVKEMTKELQMCKKRLDAYESGSPSNSLDQISRTGSNSSLSTGETLNGAVSDNSNSGDHTLQSTEPDRQTLIDRIVKLQKIRVKQAEKLDFLEEHTRTLLNELQKKSKIIKNYILHENPDAMGSNERDRNKAELARHGGIMASVYNQRVSDDNMTLELSLEINQKLQAVLEDTLLKNITLKDSIDTLGGEIARLTIQNKPRQ